MKHLAISLKTFIFLHFQLILTHQILLQCKIVKETTQEIKSVFPSIDVNLDYLKTKYNLLINSDIIVREFNLNARGKQYKALLLYIDGMVDSQILNNFVLEPLMLRNRNNLF